MLKTLIFIVVCTLVSSKPLHFNADIANIAQHQLQNQLDSFIHSHKISQKFQQFSLNHSILTNDQRSLTLLVVKLKSIEIITLSYQVQISEQQFLPYNISVVNNQLINTEIFTLVAEDYWKSKIIEYLNENKIKKTWILFDPQVLDLEYRVFQNGHKSIVAAIKASTLASIDQSTSDYAIYQGDLQMALIAQQITNNNQEELVKGNQLHLNDNYINFLQWAQQENSSNFQIAFSNNKITGFNFTNIETNGFITLFEIFIKEHLKQESQESQIPCLPKGYDDFISGIVIKGTGNSTDCLQFIQQKVSKHPIYEKIIESLKQSDGPISIYHESLQEQNEIDHESLMSQIDSSIAQSCEQITNKLSCFKDSLTKFILKDINNLQGSIQNIQQKDIQSESLLKFVANQVHKNEFKEFVSLFDTQPSARNQQQVVGFTIFILGFLATLFAFGFYKNSTPSSRSGSPKLQGSPTGSRKSNMK